VVLVSKEILFVLSTLISLCASLGMILLRRAAKDSNAEAATFGVVTFFTCFAAMIPALALLSTSG
jgi:uncharacterized membrane protein